MSYTFYQTFMQIFYNELTLTILLFHKSLLNVPNVCEKVTDRSDLGQKKRMLTSQMFLVKERFIKVNGYVTYPVSAKKEKYSSSCLSPLV